MRAHEIAEGEDARGERLLEPPDHVVLPEREGEREGV